MIPRVSKRLLLVNVILAAVAVFFVVSLVRDLTRARPLPPPPAPRRAQAAAPVEEQAQSAIAGEQLAGYNVIVAKHLFNPSRSEGGATAAAAPAAPPPPKPMLLGVVVDGPKSRAYLEDMPATRSVIPSREAGSTRSPTTRSSSSGPTERWRSCSATHRNPNPPPRRPPGRRGSRRVRSLRLRGRASRLLLRAGGLP